MLLKLVFLSLAVVVLANDKPVSGVAKEASKAEPEEVPDSEEANEIGEVESEAEQLPGIEHPVWSAEMAKKIALKDYQKRLDRFKGQLRNILEELNTILGSGQVLNWSDDPMFDGEVDGVKNQVAVFEKWLASLFKEIAEFYGHQTRELHEAVPFSGESAEDPAIPLLKDLRELADYLQVKIEDYVKIIGDTLEQLRQEPGRPGATVFRPAEV